jgi:hypothetical protein
MNIVDPKQVYDWKFVRIRPKQDNNQTDTSVKKMILRILAA